MASTMWHTSSLGWRAAYLVGLLLLQLLEDLLRLRLGSKRGHVDVNIIEDTDKGLRCSRPTESYCWPLRERRVQRFHLGVGLVANVRMASSPATPVFDHLY
jgi:hypothetical protein